MPLGRPVVAASSPPARRSARSRVTNGGAYVEKVDGRSAVARRIRDLRDELLAAALHKYNQPSRYGEEPLASPALGLGDLTTEAASLVKHTAALLVEGESMEARVAGGQDLDHNQLVRVINSAQRSLKKLRTLQSYRTVLKPDVEERMREARLRRERRYVALAQASAKKGKTALAKLAQGTPPAALAGLPEGPALPECRHGEASPYPWDGVESQDAFRRRKWPHLFADTPTPPPTEGED